MDCFQAGLGGISLTSIPGARLPWLHRLTPYVAATKFTGSEVYLGRHICFRNINIQGQALT